MQVNAPVFCNTGLPSFDSFLPLNFLVAHTFLRPELWSNWAVLILYHSSNSVPFDVANEPVLQSYELWVSRGVSGPLGFKGDTCCRPSMSAHVLFS